MVVTGFCSCCRLPADHSTAAGVAAAASTDWERPVDTAAADLCEASTSYSVNSGTNTRPAHGRHRAMDTGIALAAATEDFDAETDA